MFKELDGWTQARPADDMDRGGWWSIYNDPLLDGGKRGAAVEAARTTYEQAVANYRNTVLTGFQEVEDNLAGLRILAQQAEVQSLAVASARDAVRIALNQYKAGTTT